MANTLANLARMYTETAGTGTLTLISAVPGFNTFAEAGVPDGATITYAIYCGPHREIGAGVWTATTKELTRATVYSSTRAGNRISLSGRSEVFITPAKEDLLSLGLNDGDYGDIVISNQGQNINIDSAVATTFGRSLMDDADATAGRATLQLGSMSTQADNNVSITGGSITGITDLAVADGGTGVSTLSAGFVKANGTSPFTSASAVNLASEVTGTLPVGNGGTGATTLTGVVKGTGTSALTASAIVDADISATAAIANSKLATMAANTIKGVSTSGTPTDLSASSARTVLGLGTMATQDASNVTITGGSITNISGFLSDSNTSTQNAYFGDIHLRDDTSPSNYLKVTAGENLTADRTLTITTGNADRTLKLPVVDNDWTQAGTGASARTVDAKLKEVVSVLDFGASTSNNGATNKTAIDAAVAAVSAAGGGTVLVPVGTFDITTLANIPANVTIRGVSRSKSVLRTTSATGDVIKLDGSRAGVANLTISSSVTRSANAYVGHTANASQIFVDGVDLLAPFIGIEVSSDIAIFIITDVAIRDTVHSTGSSIIIRGGFVVHLDRVMCSQSSGAIRPANHLLIESVHDIQVVNTQFIGAATDVNIAPGNGQTVVVVQMYETLFDDAQGPAIRVAPGGTGIVREVFVESPWIFGAGPDVLVTNAGGGTVQLVNIANSLFVGTGAGVDITGANQAMVQNCRIGGHTTAISFNNVGRGLITGNLLGPNGPYGNNTTAISLVGTTANVIVQGNETSGNTTALSNSATGVNYIEMGYGKAPVTVTGTTHTIGADDEYIFNVSSTCTVTLPTASANTGRKIKLRSVFSAVVSNASNVVPVQGGSAGTAIIHAGGGWAEIVSNGTDWLVQESNRYAAIDGGTITGLSDLSVSKTTGNSATVRANSGSAYGEMTFNDAAGMYLSNSSSVPFYFYVSGSEKVRIQSDGKVGILDNAPGATLSVAGTVSAGQTAGRYFGFGTGTFSLDSTNVNDYGMTYTAPSGEFNTILAGYTKIKLCTNQLSRMEIHNDGGVVIGAPTGGTKGAGTLNAVGVYDDNVLLTDYVFDQHQTGAIKPEDEAGAASIGFDPVWLDRTYVTAFWKENRHLPWMPSRAEFAASKPSIGEMLNRLWAGQEIMATWMDDEQ